MKKRLAILFLCCVTLLITLPVTAHADTGPKPSVRITFENMGDELCYGTLLSQTTSTGPSSVWDGDPEHICNYDLDLNIWQAFADYQDTDGYYFLQEGWLCSESKQLNWTYYPPDSFKILLYYPELDKFTVSETCERYAFDSYFRVTMNGLEIDDVDSAAYDYTWETISLVCRIVVTIVLELAVAWCFRLRHRKLVKAILWVNLVTQIVLNILLNIINYNSGHFAFVAYYVLLEFVIFVLEAIAYLLLFRRIKDVRVSGKRVVLYSLTANLVSFVGGMGVAYIVPGIF